jgi:CHAD domain-containing protein
MPKKIKWQIDNLKYSKQLKKSADTILKFRIDTFISIVQKYLVNQTVENLHDSRIALRRVRYSMELFFVCYDKKVFLRFYNKIQKLQDLSGSVRDVDITIENIRLLSTENDTNLDSITLIKVKEKKAVLEELFNQELSKFISGKIFKELYKQIF